MVKTVALATILTNTFCWSSRANIGLTCFSYAGDLNLLKVPSDMDDKQVLFLSDILPTGWHATELGNVHDGDSVAIWGCGPGQHSALAV